MINTNTPEPAAIITFQLEDGSALELPPLTLHYRQISLLDVFGRVTSQLGLTYTFNSNSVVFKTKDGQKLIRKEENGDK